MNNLFSIFLTKDFEIKGKKNETKQYVLGLLHDKNRSAPKILKSHLQKI